MKKLMLIRHAEAELPDENVADFNRRLTQSGKNEAAQMAAFLLDKGSMPQFVITSPALRALTTAAIFTTALNTAGAQTNPDIYEANTNTLLQIINNLDKQYQTVALVGHNPGVSNLLYHLTSKITTMPTASWVEIELDVESWAEVSGGTGKVIRYKQP